MKKIMVLFLLFVLTLGFVTNRIIDDKIKKLLQNINLSEGYAQEMIFSDCSGNYFNIPNVKAIKALTSNDRAALVPLIGEYVKEVTSSSDFVKRYNEFRERKKPNEPEGPKNIAQMKEEQRDGIKKAIVNMEETKLKMPKDQQSSFDDMIKQYKEQLKSIDDPNNPMYSPEMEKMFEQNYQMQLADYNTKLEEWNKQYPIDNPRPMIKVWIKNFLQKTSDVDYNAKTAMDQYGKQIFVNPQYERKDYLWKMSFRAGKEPMTAVRNYAQAWLSELK